MAKTAIAWFLSFFVLTSAQRLDIDASQYVICKDVAANTIEMLVSKLQKCMVVVGYLKLCVMEKTNPQDFADISFPELKEVTGFLVAYRVVGLENLGQLFPNLARIRGTELLDNFGLIVNDMSHLREIGLYSLLKIDRGGVTVAGVPHTCHVDTIDWNAIAPRYEHVLVKPEKDAHCKRCNCSVDPKANFCWNRKKCQRFLGSPRATRCHEQCLGCTDGHPDECILCRYYTYRGHCVSACPEDTIILPDNDYCITEEECTDLSGWEFNGTCVFTCPVDYKRVQHANKYLCVPCLGCTKKTCYDGHIHSISTMQRVERCSVINGSLIIHVRTGLEAMTELRKYLGRIEEVTGHVIINASTTITSLDFLRSLKLIRAETLFKHKYSLVIYEMQELRTLFTSNVTKNLKINRGTLLMYRNPKLCRSEIQKILPFFKIKPADNDIALGMNGYSGHCSEDSVDLKVRVVNETTAFVTFNYSPDNKTEYTVLYVRLPSGSRSTIVPESCSDSEWQAIIVSSPGIVKLSFLRPASTYAVCVESYTFIDNRPHLGRSNVVNFQTHYSRPAPPFITELISTSSQAATIRWVDHKDYKHFINRYELDVSLIENYMTSKDHCDNVEGFLDDTNSRHIVAFKPQSDYDTGCESMCGIHSQANMIEEYLDLEACSAYDFNCGTNEKPPPKNSSFGPYIRSISYNISRNSRSYQVKGLAPFRDYRFRLRACIDDKCSRSSSLSIRTYRSSQADVPEIIFYSANDRGEVHVKWKSPEVTNGPIIAYFVQIISDTTFESTCVRPENSSDYSLTVKVVVAKKYFLRVCTSTLGSINACTQWETIWLTKYYLWIAISFGFLITILSVMIGFYFKKRKSPSDMVPLLDSSSSHSNVSEPISLMADVEQMYTVPLRDTLLEF